MTADEVIKKLKASGWHLDRQKGSHAHFIHPDRPGEIVTVPVHRGDLKPGTLSAILKKANLK